MKRFLAILILTAILLQCVSGLAEGSFVMAGFDGDSTDRVWDTCLFFTRMEEATGVSFTFAQSEDEDAWTDAKAGMTKDNVQVDCLFKAELTNEETQAMYEKGVLIDLRPYIEECMPNLSAILKEHPEYEKAFALPDGAIVALPSINPLQSNNAMWINTTWLETLGLSVPTTAEELTEVLRAFKTGDPNGNGKADEVPLSVTGMWDLRFLAHAFGLNFDDYGLYLDENGQVQCALTDDRCREFLSWLNQLWEEGLLSHTSFTTTDSIRQVTDTDATMTYGMFLSSTPLTLLPTNFLSQYGLLMPLEYEGKQVYRDFAGVVVPGTFAITSHCSDPAAVLRWVDYLYSEEGSILSQAGMEGFEFEYYEDGTWTWIAATEEITTTVLPSATIADGTRIPGYVSVDFQLKFEHSDTQRIIS